MSPPASSDVTEQGTENMNGYLEVFRTAVIFPFYGSCLIAYNSPIPDLELSMINAPGTSLTMGLWMNCFFQLSGI